MSEAFVGQVLITGFNFAPRGFALCNGQLVPINQNQALFSLLGTQYGGNGTTVFALPDLRGRTPISFDNATAPIGQAGGSESVTLLPSNFPPHTHAANAASGNGDSRNPSNRVFATSVSRGTASALYAPASGGLVPMSGQSLSAAGSNQAHPNMQPYITINFCIALTGIFPSRN